LLALALITGCASAPRQGPPGLFTSLPILWREAESIGDLLKPDTAPHWALAVLERDAKVRPLDSLMPVQGKGPLDKIGLLIMAQPRPLAPQENVALDRWVRGGGHVLLFADPMLTANSTYGFGDRRRPEAIAMLSPILSRWGLRLEYDEAQEAELHEVGLLGAPFPVNLPGRLAVTGGRARCTLLSEALAATCHIGRGRVLIIADAALFEESPEARAESALRRLIAAARGGDSESGK
jgi:hypothetical protein